MKRWLFALLGLVLAPLACAVTYTLPGSLPPGCSAAGANYTCAGGSLSYGDIVVINSPKPATVTINGNFNTDTSQINQGGSASDLTLIVNGALTFGYQAKIKANITATSINDGGGGKVVVTGNLAAKGGALSLAYQTTVSGNLSNTGSGTIVTPQAGTVGGSITGGTGKVTVSESTTVGSNITTNGGEIYVGQTSTVNGNLDAASGPITVAFQSTVVGTVKTTGTVAINQEAKVTGDVTAGSGTVTLGFKAEAKGNVTTDSGTVDIGQEAKVGACLKSTSSASMTLGYKAVVANVCCGASCTRTCVTNNTTFAMPSACAGSTPAIANFGIAGTGSASTCTPQTLTITAKDASGNTLTTYTGTVNLSTSSGRGDWSVGSSPPPSGTLSAGAANSGLASYTFAAGDAGIVKLRLAHSLAQNLTVAVVDNGLPATSSTSAAINYRDNAFVWAEDLASKIAGTNVVVAGRSHDLQVSLIKKDPTTGSCGVATDFTGSRNLKLWRTDNGGPWAAPSGSTGATSVSVPATRPGTNNLSLSFSAGIASLNLLTTDIGKYTLNLDDDSGSYAASTISGSLGDLTVRPYTITVSGIARGATANPSGSLITDGVLGPAGASFSATVAAYLWSAASDTNGNGTPNSGFNLASITSGGLAPSFNSTVTLSPLAASQTPTGGVLGSLANGAVSGFSGGTVTVSNLQYSEVGSFQINNTGVVSNFLGTAGLALDAVTFAANGTQNRRVGRFIPAGFALSSPSVTHRVDLACGTASTFTYLDENFQVGFTLTAQNAAGTTTQNYTGTFARLDLSTASNFKLAGVGSGTMFKTSNSRLSVSASSGSWANGVASGITLTAKALRTTTPDGPFDTASFGIAPVDPDGATMVSLDLDTDLPANGADSTNVGTIRLRFGRLRLQNGMAAANRPVTLPLAAQYWTGTAYNTNTLDSCTRIAATHLSFGTLRKTLVASDAVMSNSPTTLAAGVGRITLAAPASGHVGSMDVAIALDSATPPTDLSCLRNIPVGWVPVKAATVGAGLTALRGPWCGSGFNDPSGRAIWGLYRGDNGVLYQRENF